MLSYFRDRRSLGWLVGAFLLILVIFAFVAFYIPDFMGPGGVGGTGGEVAWVEGSPITSQEFLRRYRAQEDQYRAQLGPQFSPDLMRQLGFDSLVLRELVQNKILLLEAERQGIAVTDQEVSDLIVSLPTFQIDGQFMGRTAYLNLLAQNSLSAEQFEQQLRQDLMRQKLQDLVTDGVVVTAADVEQEYRRRNEKLHLEYAFFPSGDELSVEVTDDDARRYFEANAKKFERPLQRKVRFITFTPQLFSTGVSVSEREIERYYRQNTFRYETSEQVRASHILFEIGPDSDEEEVRRKAEQVLAQARSGADFAELAREYSDDTSAEEGGDLGPFGRGQMVPEFEEAAFSLAEGEVSDLVRTTYGYHIIKSAGRQPGFTRPLEAVTEEIRSALTQEKARAAMEDAVESAAQKLQASQSIDALSAQYPLLVPQESAFFGARDNVPQLGNSPEAVKAAFDTAIGKVSSAIRLGNGYAFLQVLEERPPGLPDFEEVKERAKSELRKERLLARARAEAEQAQAALASGGGAGIEFQSTENFFRGSVLPEAGRSSAVQTRAFELAPGELSEPLPAENGYVLLRVVEASGFSQTEFEAQRPGFQEQVENEQRGRIWNAFVQNLTSRYDVRVDWQAIRSLMG